MSRKIGEAQINGKAVSFFAPPHSEPDFPWVDVMELARAFLPKDAATRFVRHSQGFSPGKRVVVTAKNGSRIATLMCHAMAQGFTAAIDQSSGHPEEDGPAFSAYCLAAGMMARDHWPLSFEDMIAAFKNPGGPYMRGF